MVCLENASAVLRTRELPASGGEKTRILKRKEVMFMASTRKRGNSYLLVVSVGYDLAGNRRKAQQKTVRLRA